MMLADAASPLKTASLSEILGFVNAAESVAQAEGIEVRVSFLRNFTVEGIEPFLKYHFLKSGLRLSGTFGNYNMLRQEVLDPGSHIYTHTPEIIVSALHLDSYLPDAGQAGWQATGVMEELASLFNELAGKTSALVAVNTFVPPFYADLGIASVADHPNHYDQVLELNQMVREFVRSRPSRFVLMDWERFARLLGEEESMDYRFWFMSKAPFKKGFLNLYALELAKVARALKGRAKKCLVLDCDNTLWGGIVGENGPKGISLDRHAYPGNAFREFQKGVLRLRERGVLIALCSKNNEEDVWEVLDGHPDCLIRREHLSAWRVNWQDKASNLRSLAQELNLGLDSFVFVDDSPVECGLIRDLVPEVAVLQVPQKLYNFHFLLEQAGLFDTLTLSAEDRQRSQMYRTEAQRKEEQARFETLEQYLESLCISITVHEARADEIPRVAQLTQKTNQFNLTTRRYSEPQVAEFAASPDWGVVTLSAMDRFGEQGLTGVLIAHKHPNGPRIDTLLLSCRILGRNIEVAFVLKALELLEKSWGNGSWLAEYLLTPKNRQVADFWPALGFKKVAGQDGQYQLPDGCSRRERIPYIAVEE